MDANIQMMHLHNKINRMENIAQDFDAVIEHLHFVIKLIYGLGALVLIESIMLLVFIFKARG